MQYSSHSCVHSNKTCPAREPLRIKSPHLTSVITFRCSFVLKAIRNKGCGGIRVLFSFWGVHLWHFARSVGDCLSGKRITVLVSSNVLLRYKLRLHRGWNLSKHYTAAIEYVRLSAGVQVFPQQSEMGTVRLLNLYLEVHFFYVASDTNRVSLETDKHVEKILL